jgi:hypothetical protein
MFVFDLRFPTVDRYEANLVSELFFPGENKMEENLRLLGFCTL